MIDAKQKFTDKQIPAREQWLHDNKEAPDREALDSLEQDLKDVAAGGVVYKGRRSHSQERRKSDA
jgi:hypothetical protein